MIDPKARPVWRSWLAVVLLLSISGPSQAEGPARTRLDNATPERVLFVGNSYFYYNDSLHNHVVRMARERYSDDAVEFTYKSATIGGASLEQHPVEQLLEPGRLNVGEPFELVILQGGSAETLSEKGRARFRQMATAHSQTIEAAGAEIALYMTPAYVEPHRRAEAGMIDTIRDAYLSVGNELDALVIPVGIAF